MSSQSLTAAEAARRAALITVSAYQIDVDLTGLPAGPELRCVSTVRFACAQPGADTFVDCAARVVGGTLNGKPLGPADGSRIPLHGLAEANELRVETVQADTSTGGGVHRAVDPADGEVYVWMSFEPDEAHRAWACFDQPDLKAPHTFTVTAPADWLVTSNSGEARVEQAGPHRRWSFPATPPLSTYNTVVNAGPLQEIRRQAGDHDLGIFGRRSLVRVLERDADEIFTVTDQGLRFYAETFAMPFPQRRYDQVFMPEFGGAMENFGCVTWADSLLSRTPPTPAERELFATVLLHEMAHMWFGNIVTMRWWDDLWLNEAFADFACRWAAARATAYTDAWAGHLAGRKLSAYLADQGPTAHPIRQPVRDVAEAASIFDAITYPKGLSVLRQLMEYLGEDAFTTGLRAYFARHAWGNTTLQDLIDALAQASGRDLTAWREGWLDTAGTDRITFDPRSRELVARGPAGPPRPQTLAVGAYRAQGERLARTALVRVEVTGPRTLVDVPPGADLYLVNDEDLTFATVRPGAPVMEAADRLPTPLSRGVAVATAYDMLVDGETGPAEMVRCLAGVLTAETADTVIEPYLRIAVETAELWAAGPTRAALTAEVADVCAALAEQPARRQVALRFLAATAAGPAVLDRLRDQASDDVDLLWRVLARRAELGGDTADEADALLARDPDPDAKFRALAVRAARCDPDEKAAMWRMLAERTVPISHYAAVTTAFWRPGQEELLAPYPEKFLDLLPDLGRGGSITSMTYAGRLFPTVAVGADFLDRVEEASGEATPAVRKILLERADLMRRVLRARG
ncbi:aminopeptidase N [Mangrovihabitans endophyticus]|uniref:Aminopeptidase N n=1 Tax=Mangrovihabitans endophyticus TaxID=1751298 RepID=A0A8J3C578_9ACTN|nr:aminopeptidase N [Mangrovihabitans endophyticus]GGL19593.1 aminopeptidase [Mangrovihabitans endophyticus]